uniref:Methyltransferase type 11 domain-containing protein n=1 Tax=Parascaris univalens TaxID=6257 RepID=A0A915BWG6_PARUN
LHFTRSSIVSMHYLEEFDIALAIFVLHFNETIAELEEALHAIYKSLRKGGKLVAFVPNGVEHLNPMTEEEGRKLGALLLLDGDRRFDGERMIVRFYSSNGDSFNANNLTYL